MTKLKPETIYESPYRNLFTGPPMNQHEPGAKLDQAKPRVSLILGDFANALEYVSKVGTIGANKYTDHGWKEVENGFERYSNAMLRHWIKEHQGEFTDKELTKMAQEDIPHAACVAWNALARLEILLQNDKHTKFI